jgi:hypothetical protein
LDLTGNGLQQLPADLHKFLNLEELILTDNNLGIKSKETGCSTLLKSLGQIKHLKRLNLSRNRIIRLNADLLKLAQDFVELQEIDLSFNWIENEMNMWFLTQTKGINLVVITGNPVANRQTKPGQVSAYANLESELNKNLSAVVINDVGLVDEQGFYLKRKAG